MDACKELSPLIAAGGVILTALGSVLSYRAARWNLRRDLELELRRERLNALRQLWAISEPLAKYGRAGAVTKGSIDRLAMELRKWYFQVGGMFLTEPSRDAYFEFQESLHDAMKPLETEETVLDDATFESVRRKGSALRTTLRSAFKGFPKM